MSIAGLSLKDIETNFIMKTLAKMQHNNRLSSRICICITF